MTKPIASHKIVFIFQNLSVEQEAAQRFALPAADCSGRYICKQGRLQGNNAGMAYAESGQVHAVLEGKEDSTVAPLPEQFQEMFCFAP